MAGDTAGAQRRTGGVRPGAGAAALLLAGVLALVGCSSSEFEWPDDPEPAATSAVEAAENEAVEEILAAFDEFRRAEIAAQADPEPAHQAQDQFIEHLADPLLSATLFELEMLHDRGLVRLGEPTWELTVTELRLDDIPPGATVRDCLDASDWQLAHRGSGQAADADGLPERYRAERHQIVFEAAFIEGNWRFAEARRVTDAGEDGSC